MWDIKQEHGNRQLGITYTTVYEIYDEGERIDEVHACRVCLLTDCKLYSLVELNKENTYMQVSGLSLYDDERLPRSLCAECYTLLNKCMQFREKSHMGYQCFMNILEKNSEVTVDLIKKVNRKKFKLNSNLTIIQKKPNFDYQFVDESEFLYDKRNIKEELIVEYNTYKDDDHLDVMNDDTKDSTECDITETTNTEIDDPFKIVKNRKTKNIDGEKITFENVVTDNVCIDNDENLKIEPVIFLAQNNDFEAKDNIKRGKKQQHLKAKDSNERKKIYKTMVLDFERLIKKNFTIKSLNVEEQKEMISKRKSTDNYVKSAYKCDYCLRGFKRELTYKSHMMKHSENSGKFVCDICYKRYASKVTLRKHIPDHIHLYSCVSCSYTTQNRSTAKLHLEWHKGKEYKCKVCEMVFLRVSSLLSHLRIKHPTDHVCHICGYSFLGEVGLNAHCKMKHQQDTREVSSDSPRCVECDISFISQSALETHLEVSLRHASSGKLRRNEPFCGKISAVLRRVNVDKPRSVREATVDGKKITCKECGLQLRSLRAHRIHMGKKHPGALPVTNSFRRTSLCDVCGRRFKREALLRDHVLVHSESATYSCAVCSKSYKTPLSLQRHSKLHIESYPCPRCTKSFNCRANRDRHLYQVHSDTKDVKCDYCEKLFKSEREKKNHIDHVHLKKPWPKRNRHRAKDGRTIARSKSGKGTTDNFCVEQAE